MNVDALNILMTHVHTWPEVHRGGERYLHELAAGLQRAGHSVTIMSSASVAYRSTILGVDVKKFRQQPGRQQRYGDAALEVAFARRAATRAAVRPPDIWHAFGTADAAAAVRLSRFRRLRPVYTDLGIPDGNYRRSRTDRHLHQQVVDGADVYWCLSRFAASSLRRDFHREGEVILGGVDLDRFTPAKARDPRPTIMFSGAISEPRKGVAKLLDAAIGLAVSHPQLQIWLCGDGDVGELLNRHPVARPLVTFVGRETPEGLIKRYGRAWCTVLPSRDEAFGLALLESLACGTPGVALAGGGGPAEILTDRTGVLAADGTVEQLGIAVRQALDLAGRPGTAEACRRRAATMDWDTVVVPAFIRRYQALLKVAV